MKRVVSSLRSSVSECSKARSVAASAYLYDALLSVGSVIRNPGLEGAGGFTVPPIPDKLAVGFWLAKLQDTLTTLMKDVTTVSIDLTTRQYGGGSSPPDCTELTVLHKRLQKSPPPIYVSIQNAFKSILSNLATEARACTAGNSSTAATAADNITQEETDLVAEVGAL